MSEVASFLSNNSSYEGKAKTWAALPHMINLYLNFRDPDIIMRLLEEIDLSSGFIYESANATVNGSKVSGTL